MSRRRWVALGALSVLLVAGLMAAGAAAREHTRDRDRCDGDADGSNACRHARLRAHCSDNPEDERCERLRAHAQDHRQQRIRQHCADHPEDERCQPQE